MKNILIGFFIIISNISIAQKTEIYNTKADAQKEIKQAIKKASSEGKHVFIQIGGNWCPWCVKFHRFIEADSELKSLMENNYKVVKVNYDKDIKQNALMERLGFPQRFGFPVFVILNGQGDRIHTQNSAFLEKDKSYDKEVLIRFFKNWSAKAIHPDTYKK